jgi:hypothetical protein
MKTYMILFITIGILFTSKIHSMKEDTLLINLFPDSALMPVKSEKIYETDRELYDYINGGAELYLQYGFKKLAKRIYYSDKTGEIKAEIFDLKEPKNAFGVFSYSMDTSNTEIGQGGQYIGGSLIFWQDRYYVSIFAHKDDPQTKEKILELGRKISDAIGTEGTLPASYHIIPERSAVKGSTFYFHHPAWQNKFHYISNDNIFNIDQQVKAFITQYKKEGKKYYLLLLDYPGKKETKKAFKKGIKSLSPKLNKQPIVKTGQNRWTGANHYKNLLMVVFDAPSKEETEYLLNQTIENSKQMH